MTLVTLYNHQQRFIDTAPDRYGIFHACGTGKTITGLYKALTCGTQACLIICPKGVKSKWREETNKIPVNLFFFQIVTKEEFKRDWDKLSPFQILIIDEAHHFSSIKSQMHKTLIKFLKKHNVKYVYPMTATPYRREPMNIYALGKILGKNWNFIDFRNKYYNLIYFGPRAVWVPKRNIEKQIASLVRSIGDVVSFSECGDMPEITHKVEEILMTNRQRKELAELERTEANPLMYYGKEHQICAGIGALSGKFNRIVELAECNDKLAIFCRYTAQINDLRARLDELGYTVFVIDGKMKGSKADVAKVADSEKKAIVIIQMDSAEGFELPTFDVIVFASMSYSYLAYEQSLGRFIRINVKSNPKLFIYLLTKDSIDEAVHKNLLAKQDFSLEIYAKQKDIRIK